MHRRNATSGYSKEEYHVKGRGRIKDREAAILQMEDVVSRIAP